MQRPACLLLLGALALAQDEGGRDTGQGENAVLFVGWRESAETGAVWLSAWRALEPHFGVMSRRRLIDFGGDAAKARAFFARSANAAQNAAENM